MASESQSEIQKALTAESNDDQVPEKVNLFTSDNETFVVPSSHASRSETIKKLIKDGWANGSDSLLPLLRVSSASLVKIIEYWSHTNVSNESSSSSSSSSSKMSDWEKEFVKKMGKDDLLEVLLAANYMAEISLLDLISEEVEDRIKGMTVEQCREFMGIEDDFTPEEEKKIRDYLDLLLT